MKKKLIQSLKIVLPIAVGVFFIWLQLSNISSEDKSILWQQIKEANYFWLALGIVISFISHLSRAWRWNYMLEPLGFKPKFATNIAAIGIGYVLNLAIPRSGEISRAAVITKTEGIAFEKSFGTIISERLADLVILAALIFLAFVLQFDVLAELFSTHFSGQKLILFAAAGIGLALFLFLFLKFGSGFLQQKIKAFMLNLREGINSIFKMKQYKAFIYHTIFIWFMYVLMFYVSSFAVADMGNISMGALLCTFIVGSLTIAFTNGGIGAYPYFVAQILVLFGYQETAGIAFGWLLWSSQTLLTIVYGLCSYLYIALRFTKK